MMDILGISAFYHDSAAALVADGRIVAAAQEERFTRRKHDAAFPHNAVASCLSEAGIGLDDVDHVVFYDKPFLKFERLLETYHAFAPRGLSSFSSAVPVWIKEKLFMKRLLRQHLAELGSGEVPLYFLESVVYHEMLHHHLGGVPDAAGRTVYHSRAFRQAEARYRRLDAVLARLHEAETGNDEQKGSAA